MRSITVFGMALGVGLARKTPSLAALLKAIPSGGALVAPFATAFGAFAFVVPEGTEAVTMENVVVLDGLDADDLRKLLSGWLRPYRRGNAVDAVHGRALARLAKRMAGMAAEESRKRLERIVERSRKRRRTAIEAALSSLLEELWDRRSVHIASDRGAVPQRRPLAAVDLRAQCPRRRLRHPPSP